MSLPPVTRWPEVALTLGRTFGVRGAALRGAHEVRKSVNAFRITPRLAAPSVGTGPLLFRVEPARLRASGTDLSAALARADRVVAGEYQAFGSEWRALPPDAAGWRKHPTSGLLFPDAPWWKVPHLDGRIGDIKQVWEPSRFAWVYDLVRAWALTSDPQYSAAFHRLLEEWVAASPPFRGPQWACGQETAIRAIAILHAESSLPMTSVEAARISAVLGWSGERIADAIGYAISQRNNHSLSEGAALIALGVRAGGAHPDGAEWLRLGRRVLGREIEAQFAPDGWYIQHSFNYLRVALDQCVVAELALRASGERLQDVARARLGAATRLVGALVGPDGSVPNHGANDGALVLPYSLAEFGDHRPSLTLAAAMFDTPLPADIAPDPDVLAWTGLSTPATAPKRANGVVRGEGWAVARRDEVVLFLRAGRYRSRPGHLDVLQLDVRGPAGPIVVDPGSYLYNGPMPWNNGLVTARVHNGPMVDDREPGWRGPRFLWYLWPQATIDQATWDGTVAKIVAHSATGVRRTVEVGATGVVIRDQVDAGVAHALRVRWTLHPDAPEDALTVDGGATAEFGAEGGVVGWYSPRYGQRIAVRYIDALRPAWVGVELVSRIRTEP